MSSSTWRVLNGYATYQRTPMRMTSLGKCAPLKLIAIVALLNWQHGLEGETIPQIASNENLRQNLLVLIDKQNPLGTVLLLHGLYAAFEQIVDQDLVPPTPRTGMASHPGGQFIA